MEVKMKALKIGLIVLGSLILLLLIVFGIFWLLNRQGVVEPFESGDPSSEYRVLVASQGSEFKDAVVESLVVHLEGIPAYISVIDVGGLSEVNEDDWDALVLVGTVEQWKLQKDVTAYLDRAKQVNKVVVLTTAGDESWTLKGYDVEAISSASKSEEIGTVVNRIRSKLDSLLDGKPEIEEHTE
jgi:hypothetical protein